MWATFDKTAQSEQSPIGRKFAQSGHPDCEAEPSTTLMHMCKLTFLPSHVDKKQSGAGLVNVDIIDFVVISGSRYSNTTVPIWWHMFLPKGCNSWSQSYDRELQRQRCKNLRRHE
jgi:hypothetical protein